jgi:hypothetical protein
VAVAFSVSQSGGDVTNTVFALEPSIDAVRWNTTANDIKYISVVGAGVATTVYTNFDTLGYGYWGVVSETNTALHTTTNNGIWYSQKISSP